jgi:HEAT repeat protein
LGLVPTKQINPFIFIKTKKMTKYEMLRAYSAEISEYPHNWATTDGAIDTKISLIQKIHSLELPSSICTISSFLKSPNSSVRAQASKTIAFLFSKMTLKNNIYDTLKYFDIKNTDFEVFKTNFSDVEYSTILKIASFNRDGYVREKALRELIAQHDATAMPFIIFRLGDWVTPIRTLAKQGILNFKQTKYLHELSLNLPYFEWLKTISRADLSGINNEIMEFMITGNYETSVAQFHTFEDKTRLIIAKYIISTDNITEQQIQLLLNDKYCVIRQLLLKQFSKLTQNVINQLLDDKTVSIRINTLYLLNAQKVDMKEWAFAHLADDYAAIRNFARYELKHSGIDFAAFYAAKLEKNEQSVGAMAGIGELKAEKYINYAKALAQHSTNAHLRKAAIFALIKLEYEELETVMFIALADRNARVRKLALAHLTTPGNADISDNSTLISYARSLFKETSVISRTTAITFFHKIGKWRALPELLLGTIDEDEGIRNLSVKYLEIWKKNAVSLFTPPTPTEKARFSWVFSTVYTMHEERRFFKKNPALEISRYTDPLMS